jgi:hypothetical protein
MFFLRVSYSVRVRKTNVFLFFSPLKCFAGAEWPTSTLFCWSQSNFLLARECYSTFCGAHVRFLFLQTFGASSFWFTNVYSRATIQVPPNSIWCEVTSTFVKMRVRVLCTSRYALLPKNDGFQKWENIFCLILFDLHNLQTRRTKSFRKLVLWKIVLGINPLPSVSEGHRLMAAMRVGKRCFRHCQLKDTKFCVKGKKFHNGCSLWSETVDLSMFSDRGISLLLFLEIPSKLYNPQKQFLSITPVRMHRVPTVISRLQYSTLVMPLQG